MTHPISHPRRIRGRSAGSALPLVSLVSASLLAGASFDASSNGTIMKDTGRTDCADCHADTQYSYDNLYQQIKDLASKGAGDAAWTAAIQACGSGVFGPTGNCTPTPANQPPTVSATAPAAVVAPAAVSFSVNASDPDGDSVTVAATGSISGTDAATLYDDTTRTFKWEPSVAGNYSVTFTPTDSKGLAGAQSTVQFTVDPAGSGGGNDAPVLKKPVDGATLNATVGIALNIPVAATDKNGDTVKLSYSGSDGSSGDIPASFDAASGEWSGNLQWTPVSATPPTVTFTFTATDVPGDASIPPKSASVSVTVKVGANGGGGEITAIDISRAFWSKKGRKLMAAGTVSAAEGVRLKGRKLTVTDSDSGAVIGKAKIKRNRAWQLRKRLDRAPCSITVTIGEASASQEVSRAPADCGPNGGETDDDSSTGNGGGSDDGDDGDRERHRKDQDDHRGKHDD